MINLAKKTISELHADMDESTLTDVKFMYYFNIPVTDIIDNISKKIDEGYVEFYIQDITEFSEIDLHELLPKSSAMNKMLDSDINYKICYNTKDSVIEYVTSNILQTAMETLAKNIGNGVNKVLGKG